MPVDDSALDGPPPGSLESRAALALKILAGLNVAGIIIGTIPSSTPTSALQAFAVDVAYGALALLYLFVARALDRRRQWANSVIRPLLLVLVVWGVYTFVTALAEGALRIPFTTLAAGWALFASADHRPLPRLSGAGGAALVATVALIAVVLTGQPVFGWGGLLDVHARDLTGSLAVECGTPGSGPPDRIAITYDWTWSSTTFLANEDDQVVIGWNGDDADGHPLYVLGETPAEQEGMHTGSSSDVSAALADEVAARWRGSLRWGIDLGVRGITPGRIELVLMRAADQPREPEPLAVGASYVHLGVWHNDTSTVTCTW
jgi:hypothetical protein